MDSGSLLLLGNYRPSLTLARELAPLGYRIVVTRGGGGERCEYSRFVSDVWEDPDLKSDEDAFISALVTYLYRHDDVRTIIPVAEPYVAAIARHWDRLPTNRLYVTPDPATVRQCLDKPGLFAIAELLGVPLAPTQTVETYGALKDAVRRIGYPVVIRPLVSESLLNGQKAVTIGSEPELQTAIPLWPRKHQTLIVQRKVGGHRHNVYFAADQGTMIRGLEAVILETDKADGSGLATHGVTVPLQDSLRSHTEALLRALKYHGVGCAQFLVDAESDLIHFLEINPRIAGNHAVPEAAGLGLGPLAIGLAAGDPFVRDSVTGTGGLTYAWTTGAFAGLKGKVRAGQLPVQAVPAELMRLMRIAWSADIHMTWRFDDPLPTAMLLVRQGLNQFRRDATRSRGLETKPGVNGVTTDV